MAKYQKYAEYKASGFKAFGQIPNHWDVLNLRYVFDFLNEKRFPLSSLERAEKKGQYPYYGASGIIDYVDEYILNEKTILIAEDGANLLSRSTPLAFIAQGKYWVNNHAHILKPKNLQFNFWTYFLQSLDFTIYITGSAQPKLSRENLGDVVVLKPSLNEQQIIANFLDHETAKIDTLITKQEKLIELLKEKRQAVISHAVTKGLNPDVVMKDSGVEWLGQVPEHWGVSRLKNIIRSLESGCSVNAADIPAQSNELGVLKTSCVYTRSFRIEENKTVVPEDIHRVKCKVRKGAIIISRMNTPELVGASALVKVEADNIYLPDRLWQTIFFENIDIDAEYLSHFMTVQGFRDQIALGAEGASSSMQNIAKEDYLNINCLVPPLEEQIQIRAFIEQKLAVLSNLNMKAQEAVERLKERRTALISSAVTGKIDVRNWQHPNEAKTGLSA